MEYRTGTCSLCGAEYKIPTVFADNETRCEPCRTKGPQDQADCSAIDETEMPTKITPRKDVLPDPLDQ